MESKEGKEKQILRVKVAKKISIPSFVHTPLIHSFTYSHSHSLTLSFFLSPLFDFNFSFCCKHLLSQVN